MKALMHRWIGETVTGQYALLSQAELLSKEDPFPVSEYGSSASSEDEM